MQSVQQADVLVRTEIVDGVAVVTLLGSEGQFRWGTRVQEHRLNPLLIEQFNAALDAAEQLGAQALVVTGEGRFFSNGLDLQYISSNLAASSRVQSDAERLLARLLSLGMPTIAAIDGHFVAAGAMLGLAFDVRVVGADSKGLFFLPGIDIGLVYSRGMTELLKAKLPQMMWTDVICFGRRYTCSDLPQHGVAVVAPSETEVLERARQLAMDLRAKGRDAKTRETMRGIKRNLYRDALAALGAEVDSMNFAAGTWDPTGRPRKEQP